MRKPRHNEVKCHAHRLTQLTLEGSNPGTADAKAGAPDHCAH